jgi:hypothetical protein
MRKITTNLFLVSILLAGFFISCKKDKKSKREVLTKSEWSVGKSEDKINNDPYEDDVPNWPTCEKDDKIRFKTNNTYEINEGATKCDPADPDSETGSWQLDSDNTILVLDGSDYNIEELSDHTLIITTSETYGGDTYYTRLTMIR